MINLIIDNVFTEIRNAEKEIELKIWNKLSFAIRDFNPLQPPQIRHLFNRKTKKTYTGLVEYVTELLDELGEQYQLIDKRTAWPQNADFSLVKYLDEQQTIELKPRDYQQTIIDNCRPREIVHVSTGGGKCCVLTTDILTPNGWKQMKDIHPGDVVYDENGKETIVVYESPIKLTDVYEISFQDGTSIKCCKDHLWKLFTKSNNFNINIPQVLSTEQILHQEVKENDNSYKFAIPVNEPIQFSKKELLIPPYILGLLLGDNCLNSHLASIFNSKINILNKLKILTEQQNINSHSYLHLGSSSWACTINDQKIFFYLDNILKQTLEIKQFHNWLYNIFKQRNINKNFIPNEYLYSSIEDRFELAHGLIDVAGNIDYDGHIKFCTASEQLKNDFIFLIRSLGYRILVQSVNITELKAAYNISIQNNDNKLFSSIIHKQNFANRQVAAEPLRYDILKIVDIKKLNYQEEMKCIGVDSDKHTYICENFIVTHNTFIMAALIEKFNVKPVSVFADKITLCTQLREEFKKFLGRPIGLVGSGIKDIQDITIYSAQSVTEDLVKDTKVMLVDECLTYDTLIRMSDGLQKSIGDLVEKRDKSRSYRVITYNTETGEKEFKTITNFYKIPAQNKTLMLVLIKLGNRTLRIKCTDDHAFFIKDKKIYVKARELITGYEVILFDNNQFVTGTVFKAVIFVKKEQFVYDIEVEDNHNFFANDILVHNCHHLPCNMLSNISKWCSDAYYRVGVSATPWRSDGADLLIDAVCNKQRPETKISASDLIQKNYLVPCTIYWIKQHKIVNGKNYNNVYKEAIVNNMDRNLNIVQIAYQMRKTKDSIILILIQRVEHGEILLELLKRYIPSNSFTVNAAGINGRIQKVRVNEIEFLSGDDNALKRNAVLEAVRNKQCKILLGTTIFDEGLDLPAADCLILAGAGKSSTRALQRIGRVLRKHPGKQRAYVYDFLDMTPMFRRQASARNKLYKSEPEFALKNFPEHLLDFKLTPVNK